MADVQTDFLSLAELAALNTDDIAPMASRTPPAGVFHIRCKMAEGREQDNGEGKAPNLNINFQYELLGGKTIDKTIDIESMVGRTFRESYRIWAGSIADVRESIGLIKGRYAKVGLPVSGVMGGKEGQDPGWLDGAVEAEFDIQVRTFKNRQTGEDNARYDWVKPAEAAA